MASIPLFSSWCLAVLIVLGILCSAIGTFGKGGDFNKKHANRIMRWRIGAQAVAVALILLYVYLRSQRSLHYGRLNKIYTKTGDAGETALGNGSASPSIPCACTAYGTVDETNATVGMARLHATGDIDAQLAMIQNDLFDLGADLCRPDMEKDADAEYPPLRMQTRQVSRLETQIDAMTKAVRTAAQLYPAGRIGLGCTSAPLPNRFTPRGTACRWNLASLETVNPAAVKYLNRLSDWFFQAARIANDNGKNDVLWIPGANR